MWDKIAKIGIEAGKAYIANRGVDGAIEDAQKVFGWAKKGVDSFIPSNTDEETTDEEIDELPGLDFEKVQDWTDDCIAEMKEAFRKAKRYDITSREFCLNANIALYTGYHVISQMFDMEGEIDDDDYDTLCTTYAEPIDNICDQILLYIGQKCQGGMNHPKDVRIGGTEGPLCMQVYGVYPVNFTGDMTMLVTVITNGIIGPKSTITIPDSENTVAEVAFIKMFGVVTDSAEAGDLCCVFIRGDHTDALPNDSVFQIGLMPDPVSDSNAVDAVSNTIKDSEKEYLEEYKACLEDDGEISAKERRLLNRLRESLGISEERAQELEASCACNNLTSEEKEYLEEYKACLEDDGKITDRERRLLERLAKSLGISPDRADEIERLYVN